MYQVQNIFPPVHCDAIVCWVCVYCISDLVACVFDRPLLRFFLSSI